MRGLARRAERLPEWPADFWWRDVWFPITVTLHGGVPVCDCSIPQDAPTPVRMIEWEAVDSFNEPKTRSFGELVIWWIEALDSGGWRWNAESERWQRRSELLDSSRLPTGLV